MKIISEEDILRGYSMKQCLESVEEALLLQQKGKVTIPIRTAIDLEKHNGTMLYMPSYSEELGYSGVKIVSVHPDNKHIGKKTIQSVMALTDSSTGEHVALIDATLLTVMRTGALSGIATKYLAKKNAVSCLIIGCGEQAKGQISAVIEVRNLEKIMLYNKTKEKAVKLKDYIVDTLKWNGNIEIIDSEVDEALSVSDIVITATSSKKPVFNGGKIQDGTHVNGIGSFKEDMQEVDLSFLKKCNRIIVDTLEGTLSEAGDFIIPMKDGEFKEEEIDGELGELVLQTKLGRQSDKEITFFKSVGSSILDLVVAVSIYKSLNIESIDAAKEYAEN